MSDIQKISKIRKASISEHLTLRNSDNSDALSFPSFLSYFKFQISNLIFYFLILFLPTQLGRHFWHDFSFVSGIRVDYLSPTLYVTDILILLLFITWIIEKKFSIFNFQFLIKSKFKNFNIKNSFHPPVGRIKFQIGLLATIILIGVLLSKNQGAGWYGFLKLLEFIFLGFYTAHNFKKLRFNTVLFLFSVGIIFESFLAIFQYINQTSIGGIFYFFGERTFNAQTPGIANASVDGKLILRPYATFSHPNVLAGFLVIAMTILIFNFQFSIFNFRRIFYALTLLIGTVALFLTMSRVAIVLWVMILVLWIVKFSIFNFQFSIKSKFKNFNIKNSFQISNFKLKILIVGFAGVILLLSPLHSRFTNIRLSDESITQRGELIKDSFSMIRSHPIFGVGLNNFLVELPNVHKQDANVFYLQPVHNIYLFILSQTGIVGLGFFIWFMFKTFKNLKIKNSLIPLSGTNFNPFDKLRVVFDPEAQTRRDAERSRSIKFQILLIVLILGLFDHYFLTLQQGQLLFSIVLGLCWSKR